MSSFEEYYYKNIAIRLRVFRKMNNLSQEKLSELIGKNMKYIGHIERCERKVSNTILAKILEMLKVQPSEFFQFDEIYEWK